jgi:hypothetical protein
MLLGLRCRYDSDDLVRIAGVTPGWSRQHDLSRRASLPSLDRTGDHGVATLIRMNAIPHRDLARPDVGCDRKVKHLKVWNPQTGTEGSKVVRQLIGLSIDGVTDWEWAHHQRRAPSDP